MLAEFHAALGDELGRGNAALRLTLHREEHGELEHELGERCLLPNDELEWRAYADGEVDRAGLARELADVVYIAYGTAHAFGINLDIALAEIHRAAMSKVDPPCDLCYGIGAVDTIEKATGHTGEAACPACAGSGRGKRVVRDDGKIMRPAGFVHPDMSAAVTGTSDG